MVIRKERLKVVVRKLPPGLLEVDFRSLVDKEFKGRYVWFSYFPGKISASKTVFSRAYLSFNSSADIYDFKVAFDGHLFVGKKGNQYRSTVEYAPHQNVPSHDIINDPLGGTIETDPVFLEFVKIYELGYSALSTATSKNADLNSSQRPSTSSLSSSGFRILNALTPGISSLNSVATKKSEVSTSNLLNSFFESRKSTSDSKQHANGRIASISCPQSGSRQSIPALKDSARKTGDEGSKPDKSASGKGEKRDKKSRRERSQLSKKERRALRAKEQEEMSRDSKETLTAEGKGDGGRRRRRRRGGKEGGEEVAKGEEPTLSKRALRRRKEKLNKLERLRKQQESELAQVKAETSVVITLLTSKNTPASSALAGISHDSNAPLINGDSNISAATSNVLATAVAAASNALKDASSKGTRSGGAARAGGASGGVASDNRGEGAEGSEVIKDAPEAEKLRRERERERERDRARERERERERKRRREKEKREKEKRPKEKEMTEKGVERKDINVPGDSRNASDDVSVSHASVANNNNNNNSTAALPTPKTTLIARPVSGSSHVAVAPAPGASSSAPNPSSLTPSPSSAGDSNNVVASSKASSSPFVLPPMHPSILPSAFATTAPPTPAAVSTHVSIQGSRASPSLKAPVFVAISSSTGKSTRPKAPEASPSTAAETPASIPASSDVPASSKPSHPASEAKTRIRPGFMRYIPPSSRGGSIAATATEGAPSASDVGS